MLALRLAGFSAGDRDREEKKGGKEGFEGAYMESAAAVDIFLCGPGA